MIQVQFLRRLHFREFKLQDELNKSSKIADFPSESASKRHSEYLDQLQIDLSTVKDDIEVYVRLHQDKAS